MRKWFRISTPGEPIYVAQPCENYMFVIKKTGTGAVQWRASINGINGRAAEIPSNFATIGEAQQSIERVYTDVLEKSKK